MSRISAKPHIITPVLGLFGVVGFLFYRRYAAENENDNDSLSADNKKARKPSAPTAPKQAHKDGKLIAESQQRTVLDASDLFENGLVVKPIGIVQSIYRLCVGTPRQGLLAPHARGRLELSLEDDAVLGLDGYSHIWVVFVFHLNTKRSSPEFQRTKVSPPALGGKKVGILSTRTPHRFNPIGITLCKLDRITRPTKSCKKTFLEVTGLDLVDGTPILDIKPFVSEYDSVPPEEFHLPSWVSGGLSTRRNVTITPSAREQLENIICKKPNVLDFYGTHRGDASWEEAVENVLLTIEEVLSIDVRSSYQTKKVRKGKFQAERASRMQDCMTSKNGKGKKPTPKDNHQVCTQQLDKLLISYTVEKPKEHDRTASVGSGAEDEVFVQLIQLLGQDSVEENSATESKENVRMSKESSNLTKDSDRNQISKSSSNEDNNCCPTNTSPPSKATLETNVSDTALKKEKSDQSSTLLPASNPTTLTAVTESERSQVQQQSGTISSTPVNSDLENTSNMPDVTPEIVQETDEKESALEPEKNNPSSIRTTSKKTNSYKPALTTATTIERPPEDSDYRSLKSYWSNVSSRNTPMGITPKSEISKINPFI